MSDYRTCRVLSFVQLIRQWDFRKEKRPQSLADYGNWQVCVCISFFPLILFVSGVYVNTPYYCLALLVIIWSLLSRRLLGSASFSMFSMLYRGWTCNSWNPFRYRMPAVRNKLPGWIVSQLFMSPTFGPGFAAVRKVWFVCVAYMYRCLFVFWVHYIAEPSLVLILFWFFHIQFFLDKRMWWILKARDLWWLCRIVVHFLTSSTDRRRIFVTVFT